MKHSTALLAGVAALALSAGSALAQVSDDVVKIGVLNDQSGTYADLAGPGSTLAAQMAVDDFGGTVLGKKIEVVFADHQNKPDVGSSIVNRWIDAEQVDVVVDVPTSSVALAVQEITNRKGKVHLNSTAATSDLTGKACSPTGVHWTYSTTALANGTGKAIVAQGGKNWFFLTADYAFGHALERDVSKVVKEAGGEVKGVVRHPFPNQDFSSFLLQAQASGAQVIGLANAGADTINSIKQAGEFGITQAGQKLAGLLVFLSDIHSLGLDTAQGLQLTTGFYWDMDDEARAYSAVAHYLKAIKEAGTDDGKKVVDKMKELPVKDFFARNASLRADGRMVHDMYLVEVKKPSESKGPWDYYKVLRTISGEDAYGPMSPACPLVKG